MTQKCGFNHTSFFFGKQIFLIKSCLYILVLHKLKFDILQFVTLSFPHTSDIEGLRQGKLVKVFKVLFCTKGEITKVVKRGRFSAQGVATYFTLHKLDCNNKCNKYVDSLFSMWILHIPNTFTYLIWKKGL